MDIEARTIYGGTPLYVSTRKGMVQTMEMVIDYRPDSITRNNEGQTLMFAAVAGEQKHSTIPMLLKSFTTH
jgi:hypothetical protein